MFYKTKLIDSTEDRQTNGSFDRTRSEALRIERTGERHNNSAV